MKCESTDVVRTENKWEHYLKNRENERFLDFVQLEARDRTAELQRTLAFRTDSCVRLGYPFIFRFCISSSVRTP